MHTHASHLYADDDVIQQLLLATFVVESEIQRERERERLATTPAIITMEWRTNSPEQWTGYMAHTITLDKAYTIARLLPIKSFLY